jgi:hypothetical protein
VATPLPVAPVPEPAAPPPSGPQNFLSDDQINRIRQCELRPDDSVRVAIDRDVLQRYLKSSSDDPQNFAAFDPTAQALRILGRDDPTLSPGVKILSDPQSLDAFRRRIQVRILVGCAAAGCHGSGAQTGAGDFYLDRDAIATPAMYTNFYILQQYRLKLGSEKTVWGAGRVERRMIDRTHPPQSLLVQYGLPRELAEMPHPPAAGWRAMFAGPQDPQYSEMLQWIGQTLLPLDPDYGFHFDLATIPAPATQPAASQ